MLRNFFRKMTNHSDGYLGEQLAEQWLSDHGFTIITKNYRYRKWEIDIISKQGDLLIFVEVKLRRTSLFGEPWRSVNRKKQAFLCTAAHHYVQKKQFVGEIRFDIISILPGAQNTWEITHIQDAFRPELI